MSDTHFDIFYFRFGILRQSIWFVEPRMKQVMLTQGD